MRVRGRAVRYGALGCLAFLAGACSNPWADHKQNADQITWSGWASDEYRSVAPRIYCYRTLADSDCHAAPLPGDAHRLVGYEGLPPGEAFPAQ